MSPPPHGGGRPPEGNRPAANDATNVPARVRQGAPTSHEPRRAAVRAVWTVGTVPADFLGIRVLASWEPVEWVAERAAGVRVLAGAAGWGFDDSATSYLQELAAAGVPIVVEGADLDLICEISTSIGARAASQVEPNPDLSGLPAVLAQPTEVERRAERELSRAPRPGDFLGAA